MPYRGATCHGDNKLNYNYDGSAQGFGYNFYRAESVSFPKMRDLVDELAILIWSNSENNVDFVNCENSDSAKPKK